MATTMTERVTRDYLLAGQRAQLHIQVPSETCRALPCPSLLSFMIEKLEPNSRYVRPTWLVKMIAWAGTLYVGKLDDFTGQVDLTERSDPIMRDHSGQRVLKLLNHLLARIWCDDHEAYEQHGFKVTREEPFKSKRTPGEATVLPSGMRWTGD